MRKGISVNGKRIVVWCVVLTVLWATSAVHAATTIRGYDPKKHDRFYTGGDREFIGESFDWSGVGKTSSSGSWATMVSPKYFLTARHAAPGYGSSITFYEDNTRDHSHSYTVDSWTYSPPHYFYDHYDLCLRRLAGDIPDEDNITYYPVLALESDSEYIGMEIYVHGKTDRVGRNIIDRIRYRTLATDPYTAVHAMEFDYDDPGVGDDECRTEGGDSGGPSFAICNNSLALVGTHAFSSGDNFVPYHIDELNANMGTHSLTLCVPEPATLMLLLIFGVMWLVWCRYKAAL